MSIYSTGLGDDKRSLPRPPAANIDPDMLLTRKAAAAALTKAGFPTTEKTLATKASRGGGPPYRKFGPRAIYQWGETLAWAWARLGGPIGSTSETDAA
jgi:hypothetical protein